MTDDEPTTGDAASRDDPAAVDPVAADQEAADQEAPVATPPRRSPVTRERGLLALLGVVLLVLVVWVVVDRTGGDSSSDPASSPETTSGDGSTATAGARSDVEYGPLGDLSRRDPGDPRALGDVDAPVVMVVFSDMRCPFCGEYSREIQPELIERYVDSGALRIEWRDLPMFGDQSELAAQAGWAAAAQGRFWEFVREIYRTPATGHPDLPIDVLVGHARAAGVPDLGRFREETLGGEYEGKVDDDRRPAVEMGVLGVPAFSINGDAMVGVRPAGTFHDVIARHLPPE